MRRFDCPSAVPVWAVGAASAAQNGWKTTERLLCLAGDAVSQTFNHGQLQAAAATWQCDVVEIMPGVQSTQL